MHSFLILYSLALLTAVLFSLYNYATIVLRSRELAGRTGVLYGNREGWIYEGHHQVDRARPPVYPRLA